MDLLKKIFILTLFFFPLGEMVRINLGNSIILKPIDVGVGLTVFLWTILKLKERGIVRQKYFIPIIFFVSIGLFSLLINYSFLSFDEFLSSLLYLVRWTIYACIFFVVNDFDNKFKKRITDLLLIVGSLVVGFGYIQYFFYSSLKSLTYLGWDEHMYRMFSTFLDPNFAGAFFVLFFLLLTNLFLKKKDILIGLFLVITLGAIFLTFSRSTFIMLILGSSLLFILLNKKKFILVILGITIIVLLISLRYFNIENINLFRVVSSEARLESAGNAIKIIQDKPIFGVGFNAYRYAQLRLGLRNARSEIISHADAGVDNSFLFVLATTGIVGFIAYIFMWFKILKTVSFLCIASIVGIFIDSLFINSLFYTYIMFWLWTIIGVKENN